METEVLTFIKNLNPKLCVMATVSEGEQPECAVLAYVIHDDLSLTLSTHSTSRKWKNIKDNQKVALTFGWDFTNLNIQYEGLAEQVEQGEDHRWHEEKYFEAHPELKKFQGSETVFIKVTPTWIRLSDFTQHPPKMVETKFK